MSSQGQEPIFDNEDAAIIILEAGAGVTDSTRRPVSATKRKALEKQLAKEAELRRLLEQMVNVGTGAKQEQPKESPLFELEQRFDAAMMDIYRRAKTEAKYNANRYFQMLTDHRGLETARILLHADSVSDGYTALWERGRLDLTVEALIHEHLEYHPLFTDEERAIARSRLEKYKYPLVIEKR